MSISVLACGCVLAMGAAGAQDPVLLRRPLEPGAKDEYKVEFQIKQMIDVPEMGGPQPFGIAGVMKSTVQVGQPVPDKGVSKAELVLSEVRLKFDGLAAMMESLLTNMPKEMRYQGTIDPRNRLADMKPVAQNPVGPFLGVAATAWGQMAAYPDQTVKVGDAWELTLPKAPGLTNKEAKLQFKAAGAKELEGKTLIVLAGEGTIEGTTDLTDMMSQAGMAGGPGGGARIYGPLKVKVEYWVDPATGRLHRFAVQMAGKQTLDLASMGLVAPVDVNITSQMTLLKPGESTLEKIQVDPVRNDESGKQAAP